MEITEKLRVFLTAFCQMVVLKIVSVYQYFDNRQLGQRTESELLGRTLTVRFSAGGQGMRRGCEMTVS